MTEKEIIEKLKHNWKPFCKLSEREQEFLEGTRKSDLLYWSAWHANWTMVNIEFTLSSGTIYRIHTDYQPQPKTVCPHCGGAIKLEKENEQG